MQRAAAPQPAERQGSGRESASAEARARAPDLLHVLVRRAYQFWTVVPTRTPSTGHNVAGGMRAKNREKRRSPECFGGHVSTRNDTSHTVRSWTCQNTTRFFTNGANVARRDGVRCDGSHSHVRLLGGKAHQARTCPDGLCDAIARGLKEDKEERYRSFQKQDPATRKARLIQAIKDIETYETSRGVARVCVRAYAYLYVSLLFFLRGSMCAYVGMHAWFKTHIVSSVVP